jgi:hypothetical protein
MALTLPLAIGLVMLLGWNLYLALSNKTTIEFHEGVTASIQVLSLADHCPHHDMCTQLRGRAALVCTQHWHELENGACLVRHGQCLEGLFWLRLLSQAGRAGAAAYKHPYDLGLCGNLHAMCGHSPSSWLLPTAAAAHGDGLVYPTSWDGLGTVHGGLLGL